MPPLATSRRSSLIGVAAPRWNSPDIAWKFTRWTSRLFFATPFARGHVRRGSASRSTALTCATSVCRVPSSLDFRMPAIGADFSEALVGCCELVIEDFDHAVER
jgi:hypothetical protein